MADKNRNNDPLTKGLGTAIALGALALGAAAAFLNNERTRQMRDDLQRQISDVSNRLDRELVARRPEIEDAIQRGKQAAVGSLDRVRGVVEQSADRAQEYVQRASAKTSDTAVDLRDKGLSAPDESGAQVEDKVNSITTRADDSLSGAASEGVQNVSNTGNEQGDTDLSDPAREAVAESGDAFGDMVGSAGGTIGSANVEAAQSLDDAAYDRAHNISAGENAADDAPGMADYRADTGFGADMSMEKPGDTGSQTQ